MRKELEAELFQNRAAHLAGVDGDVADPAPTRFVEPSPDQRRVDAAVTQLRNGGSAPQASEGAARPKSDPATGGRRLADGGEIHRQRLWGVVHLVGESVGDVREAVAIDARLDRRDVA